MYTPEGRFKGALSRGADPHAIENNYRIDVVRRPAVVSDAEKAKYKGDPGDKGEKGQDGAAGERGDKGLDGEAGEDYTGSSEKGGKGEAGEAAPLAVWKVVGKVVRDGVSSAAVTDYNALSEFANSYKVKFTTPVVTLVAPEDADPATGTKLEPWTGEDLSITHNTNRQALLSFYMTVLAPGYQQYINDLFITDNAEAFQDDHVHHMHAILEVKYPAVRGIAIYGSHSGNDMLASNVMTAVITPHILSGIKKFTHEFYVMVPFTKSATASVSNCIATLTLSGYHMKNWLDGVKDGSIVDESASDIQVIMRVTMM